MTSESHMLEPPSTMPTTTWTGFLTVRWLLIGLMKKLPADPVRKWGPRAPRTGPCWLPSTTSLEFKVRVTGGQGLDSPWPNFFFCEGTRKEITTGVLRLKKPQLLEGSILCSRRPSAKWRRRHRE